MVSRKGKPARLINPFKAEDDPELRQRRELVNEQITLTSIEQDSTWRGTPRWIAWGRYDGVKVKVTIWQESQPLFAAAGYTVNWHDNAADGVPVNIEVVLDWKQSCGYIVREVLKKEALAV